MDPRLCRGGVRLPDDAALAGAVLCARTRKPARADPSGLAARLPACGCDHHLLAGVVDLSHRLRRRCGPASHDRQLIPARATHYQSKRVGPGGVGPGGVGSGSVGSGGVGPGGVGPGGVEPGGVGPGGVGPGGVGPPAEVVSGVATGWLGGTKYAANAPNAVVARATSPSGTANLVRSPVAALLHAMTTPMTVITTTAIRPHIT